MKKYQYLLTGLFLLASLSIQAQKMERKNVRQGNKLYEEKKFTKAEIKYRKALEVNPHSSFASYNLGNALFKQNKAKEALEQYQASESREKDPRNKAAIMHNSGNVFMGTKEYQKAVDLYKSSLRLNPSDNETRYNLAMAQALLKNQNQNKDNKDKKKDKQDQQKQQQQQQQQQDQKQNKQNKDQQKQGQEQVSKEKAQQMLDALGQDEKETQDKVKKLQMQRSKAKKTDKDW